MLNFKIKTVVFAIFLLIGAVSAQTKTVETPNFIELIKEKLHKSYRIKLSQICPIETNLAARRVFYDYGAIFVSNNGGKLPARCIFQNENQVSEFQGGIPSQTENIGGVTITLQKPAMEALIEARRDAAQKGLSITPRGGSIAGSRSFEDTYRLWNSRFLPALNYWVKRGKISRAEAEEAKAMGIQEQVARVLEWEEKGFYFSTGFNKSILYSVAAPGASQHIFRLALDIQQFGDKRVRDILSEHGWFQTVKSDLPHFTYLGVNKEKLPSLGLIRVSSGGQTFWIPNV
ncbi:MAG: hypothetical protein R2747_18360 [Pyrinomonadaceae bacterium]